MSYSFASLVLFSFLAPVDKGGERGKIEMYFELVDRVVIVSSW